MMEDTDRMRCSRSGAFPGSQSPAGASEVLTFVNSSTISMMQGREVVHWGGIDGDDQRPKRILEVEIKGGTLIFLCAKHGSTHPRRVCDRSPSGVFPE